MKLLFDQNHSPKLVGLLAELFPDSAHVYRLDLDEASDQAIYDYARREGYLVVTKDSDFCDLCSLRGFPPKVIWICTGNCSTDTIESLLRSHGGDIEEFGSDPHSGILGLL
ncbi:MAG: DUF5615 family PIN-like protein [Pyrinomonadaceae bacterium]